MTFANYLIPLVFISCSLSSSKQPESVSTSFTEYSLVDSTAKTIHSRFTAQTGYTTMNSDTGSFAFYLQNLPLKPMGTQVKYYDGDTKHNNNVYCSVVDMDIDPVDLQQCADAVMRLRGEYLYHQKRYNEIKFNFLSDGKPRYYKDYAKGDYSYAKFRKYMKYIFSYANTASMCNELKSRPINEMQIGDVFVMKGNPYGHAVTVVNMAQDSLGNKQFMIAQSYMPAQETQILLNNANDDENNPWYSVKEGIIRTPEWEFSSTDLKHF